MGSRCTNEDRLVDNYENSILSHLNEEYFRKTTWSNRVAD
jgi:hypothetical protein